MPPSDWHTEASTLVAAVATWALPDDPIEVRVCRRAGPADPPELSLAEVREKLYARVDRVGSLAERIQL